METTVHSHIQEAFTEQAKATGKWIHHATETMIDTWQKQWQTASVFYNTMLHSFMDNKHVWNPAKLLQNPNAFVKPFTTSFQGAKTGADLSAALFSQAEQAFKQIQAYNEQAWNTFTSQTEGQPANWNALYEKYQKSLENQLESTQQFMNTWTTAYEQHASSSLEATNKLQNELGKHVHEALKQQQEFWNGLFAAAPEASANGTKLSKDGIAIAEKKPAKTAVNF